MVAPAPASLRAMASPIPVAAPVTMAVCPLKSNPLRPPLWLFVTSMIYEPRTIQDWFAIIISLLAGRHGAAHRQESSRSMPNEDRRERSKVVSSPRENVMVVGRRTDCCRCWTVTPEKPQALHVGTPQANRILDCGCGTGWVTFQALISGNPLRVGIDLDENNLRLAAQQNGLNVAKANALKMPFADNTFDVLIGHVSMPYMKTPDALREIFRVLTPGGSFLLTFHSFSYARWQIGRASCRERV